MLPPAGLTQSDRRFSPLTEAQNTTRHHAQKLRVRTLIEALLWVFREHLGREGPDTVFARRCRKMFHQGQVYYPGAADSSASWVAVLASGIGDFLLIALDPWKATLRSYNWALQYQQSCNHRTRYRSWK